MGVTRGQNGDIAIVFPTCRDEIVHRVRLEIATGVTSGDGDDEAVWEIALEGENDPPRQFVVGETPPGFIEVVEYSGVLPSDEEMERRDQGLAVWIHVSADSGGTSETGVSFDRDELREGIIHSASGEHSVEEFEDEAANSYGRGGCDLS